MSSGTWRTSWIPVSGRSPRIDLGVLRLGAASGRTDTGRRGRFPWIPVWVRNPSTRQRSIGIDFTVYSASCRTTKPRSCSRSCLNSVRRMRNSRSWLIWGARRIALCQVQEDPVRCASSRPMGGSTEQRLPGSLPRFRRSIQAGSSRAGSAVVAPSAMHSPGPRDDLRDPTGASGRPASEGYRTRPAIFPDGWGKTHAAHCGGDFRSLRRNRRGGMQGMSLLLSCR